MAATTIVPRIPISNSIAANSNPRRRRRSNSFGFPVAIRATALSHNSALLRAAKHTVDTYIENGMVVGLGSGQASAMAIQYLGGKLRSGALKDLVGIPMYVDFAFNDADVVEQGTLVAVIGRRKLGKDESMIQEKRILNAASKLVFMVTEEQYKIGPDGSIPVLIQPLGWMDTAEELDDLFLGDAEVWRRSSMGGAGPTGGDFPLVTKEGHHILDLIFTSPISLGEVAETLDNVGGVVDHGVILKYPCTAVIASENGVRIVDKLPATIEE
ncbi:Probable ribose-5-phosphate isomerase 4, chloroplastic [Linum perenne]